MAYTPRGSYGGNIDLYGSTLMDLYTESLTDDELLEALPQIIELGAGPEQLANLFSSSRYRDRDNDLWLDLVEEMLQGRDPTSFRPPVGDFRTNSTEIRDSILDRFREKGLYTPQTPPAQVPAESPTAPLTSSTSPSATPTTPATGTVATPSVSRASIVTGGATPKRTRTPMEMSPREHALLDKLRKTSTVDGAFDIGQGEEARRQSWVDPAQVKKRAPGVSAASAAHPNATLDFGTRGATVDPKKYIGGVADGIDDILGEDTGPNRFRAGTLGMSDVHPDIASAATPREGLPGLFDRIFGAPSQKATATSRAGSGGKGFGGLFSPELSGNLKGIGDKIGNPQFNYTAGTGLKGWGKNLGGWYTGIKGGADAIGILNNLSDSAKEKTNTQDLQSDILTAAMSNPMSTYSLTSDQLKLLGDIRAGRRDEGADLSDFDMGAGIKGAITGALTGLPGGWTGAILGGLGGFAKEGTAGLAAGQQRRNAELEALYQTLNASNVDYKNAMRQRMMQRYF